ncbi:hypothetical protein ACHAXN_006749 [Cyclotella atomus]
MSKDTERSSDGHDHSDDNRCSRSRSGSPRYRRRSHSKKKKHRRSHRLSPSVSSDSSSRGRKSHRRKHSKKEKKQKKRKRSRRDDHSQSASSEESHSTNHAISSTESEGAPGAHSLASALNNVFISYPSMASLSEGGLPLIFLQLGKGSEFNLNAMPDRRLAGLLEDVFGSLIVHGMHFDSAKGWSWLPEQKRDRDDLALLRLVRALMSSVGITSHAFQKCRQMQLEKEQQAVGQQQQTIMKSEETEPSKDTTCGDSPDPTEVAHHKRIERLTSQVLSRFDPQNSSSQTESSTLATELQGISRMLLEGEIVQLDGLENDKLKASLTQLFTLVGLVLVEMDDDDEDGEADESEMTKTKPLAGENDVIKSYGYALPEEKQQNIASNLNVVLRVCQFKSSDGLECAPVAWAASRRQQNQDDSSSDEDGGPAPIGTMAAVKAAKRAKHQIASTTAASNAKMDTREGREDWMLTPGEHDFLKGIQSKQMQNRTFKNERNRGQSTAAPIEQINPEVLAEVNAIQQAFAESRGPSLIDAHRQSQQEAKAGANDKKDWKWNREKNLDDGRRVDKNALHLILGGAKTELATKFQGSMGR